MEQEACQQFMNLAFTLIVRRVFEEQVFAQVIGPSVEWAQAECGFADIKGRCTLGELR